MADTSRKIHAAIVAALKADSAVSAIVGSRIYDRVPQSVTFPYGQVTVEIGEPYDGADLQGWEAVVRIDWWSRKNGQSGEVYNVASAAYAVLHGSALTAAGTTIVNGRLLPGGQRLIRDDDRKTAHILQRYRFVTHQ